MGIGYLKVEVTAADGAVPVGGARIALTDPATGARWETVTNEVGETGSVALTAPDMAGTLAPGDAGPHYAVYTVSVEREGYVSARVEGVQIYDTVTSILPVNLIPAIEGDAANVVEIPPPAVEEDGPREQPEPLASARVLREVVIPDYITVHLGRYDQTARDIRVRFTDYIKNVASSEIYPTWPEASLEANILCQISFALNRVFTEWYRSRGYSFDITSSTATDQYFVEGRDIFANISRIVDRLFNSYVGRPGLLEPYFTQFCNGTTATCRGLSQWGTVTLAQQGRTPLEILRHYYPNDVEIITSDNIRGIPQSYPGYVLREGSSGEAVEQLQRYLNRIRVNYPLIPAISPADGQFGAGTTQAVRTFQQIFDLTRDGLVGSATWYKVSYLYTAVTRLADLESEGERIGIGYTPPTSVLQTGSRGADVNQLQFILNFLAEFYPEIPTVTRDASFGAGTKTAVMAFQRLFGLTADGVVGPATWSKLYEAYHSAATVETPGGGGQAPAYPGHYLGLDSRGDDVRLMQTCLNAISEEYPSIPKLSVDGIFGPATREAVIAFQRQFGLAPDGIIGPLTWEKIVEEYGGSGGPAYPGYYLSIGIRGDEVRTLQNRLNRFAAANSGLSQIGEDGIFGPATREAVMAFQLHASLTVDGIVGPATWEALMTQ